MTIKKVSDSTMLSIQQMMPQDANLAGNVHGGVIMKLIDNTAAITAFRHTQRICVTASIDRLDFHSPVFIGDLLRVTSSINYIGKKSMEVGVRVEAENVLSGEVRHTASAYLTFVPLDEHHKAVEVAPIIFETEMEKRRNCEAQKRRDRRFHEREMENNSECVSG